MNCRKQIIKRDSKTIKHRKPSAVSSIAYVSLSKGYSNDSGGSASGSLSFNAM